MKNTAQFVRLHFEGGFDEQAQSEAEARGYRSHVSVEDERGDLFSVVFYDCARLAQDLEYEVSDGRMCIAEPGLIVLPAVTLANMEAAVRRLAEEGYFAKLVPAPARQVGA